MRNLGKVSTLVLVAVAWAGLAACDNGQRPDGSSNANAPLASSAVPAADRGGGRTGRPCTADDIKVSGAVGESPTITLPKDCAPPKDLVTKDLAPGSGAAAKTGDMVTTNYLLQTWSDGQVVDSSWEHQQPLTIQHLGDHEVITGWDQGLVGVKQGTRRLLIIPPRLGYGSDGNPPVKPNETLVFVVDVVKVGS